MTFAVDNEPLHLRDGRTVLPDGTIVRPAVVEVPAHSEAVKIVTNTRRKLSELPVPPATANAISVVISYTLMGLDDDEIAIATGMTVKQIGQIRISQPYAEMQDHVVKTVLDSDMDDVRSILAQGAKKAARKLVSAVNADEPGVFLRAADSILDRSGHRPVDIHEHRVKLDGGLVIQHIKRGDIDSLPTITLPADGVKHVSIDDAS